MWRNDGQLARAAQQLRLCAGLALRWQMVSSRLSREPVGGASRGPASIRSELAPARSCWSTLAGSGVAHRRHARPRAGCRLWRRPIRGRARACGPAGHRSGRGRGAAAARARQAPRPRPAGPPARRALAARGRELRHRVGGGDDRACRRHRGLALGGAARPALRRHPAAEHPCARTARDACAGRCPTAASTLTSIHAATTCASTPAVRSRVCSRTSASRTFDVRRREGFPAQGGCCSRRRGARASSAPAARIIASSASRAAAGSRSAALPRSRSGWRSLRDCHPRPLRRRSTRGFR